MRKAPRQARSRQLVETLIDATACCIADHGLDALTTPMVAERAGVSVGSLYQYFNDKDDLVRALLERLAERLAKGIGTLTPPDTGNFRALTRHTIEAGFHLLHSDEGLYLELIRHWDRLPMDTVVNVLQAHLLNFARLYFIRHHHDLPVERLHVKLYIIINSTLFTTMRFLSQPPPMMTEAALIDELTDMIASWLGA